MLERNTHYFCNKSLLALPGLRHGFFTRRGGVSEGIYASLNVGSGSDDDPAHIAENRRRVTEVFGVDAAQLCTLYQVHGDRVLAVDTPFGHEKPKPQADAMVTDRPGLVLGILTADCAPVLFADAQAGVIGACHAGWKGAFANIMARTVEAMEALGAEREGIAAVLGPCIAQASYEVDSAFRTRFLEQDMESEAFFIPSKEKVTHHHFDLPGFIEQKLLALQLGEVNLLAKDTCFDENAFFSNRRRNLRGEPDYGRQVSAIMLEGV